MMLAFGRQMKLFIMREPLPELNYMIGERTNNSPKWLLFRRKGEASFILGTKRSTTVIAGSNGLKAKLINV